MPIFIMKGGKLQTLSAEPFQYERQLQNMIENNLMMVLDMHYLASEYPMTNGCRIDTLAVDMNGAPAIIEYKRSRNGNVISQALSYLKSLRSQRPEFFKMLMINTLGKTVADNIALDWNHPRVICIAESFNRFDMDTAEIVPLRIELYRYCRYADGIFKLEPVLVNDQQRIPSGYPVQPAANNSVVDLMKSQSKAGNQVRRLFDELRERILAIDDQIVEKTIKKGMAYVVSKHFAEIQLKRDSLVIDLRPIDYVDPKNRIERIGIGYTITLNRRIRLQHRQDLDYVFSIIEQSYKNVL
ncbi:MAG: DUF5655 domain-containing protein [Betaproteobacteria bacterium]|nr:DUF5655 domain-containing protein [Betaproteobacteria bacterium]